MDDSVRLRPATEADLPAIADLMAFVFHDTQSDEMRELEYLMTEWQRSLVAVDGTAIVGHTTAQSREMTVPGGVIPVAHVTAVGVSPTHRRRGILNALMHRQLTETARAAREPIAALTASETAIYPRYGYGLASSRFRLEIKNRETAFTPVAEPAGALRVVRPADAVTEMAALLDRVRPDRVGMSSRPAHLWKVQLADLEAHRDGATELRGVVCDGPDGPTGYALWRVADRWTGNGPDGELRLREIVATDAATYARLWSFLLGVDLVRTVKWEMAALDEPLQHLVSDVRQLGARHFDLLWVRLLDLPAALETRRYLAPVDLVLEVTDPLLEANTGRWRLTAGPEKVSCVRTGDPADLACSVTDLGALYLGGTPLGGLIASGRVRALTGNVPSTTFDWHRLPSPIEVF